MVRVMTVVIMCICLDGLAFGIIGVELCFRMFSIMYDGPNMSAPDALIMTVLFEPAFNGSLCNTAGSTEYIIGCNIEKSWI